MIDQSARQPAKLASSILNYFTAFTETRFNFRTLINYRWTDNELTLDLSIFQEFQNQLVARIRSGDRSSISIKANQHVLRLSGDKVCLAVSGELSESFGPAYPKSCVEAEVRKVAEKTVSSYPEMVIFSPSRVLTYPRWKSRNKIKLLFWKDAENTTWLSENSWRTFSLTCSSGRLRI